MDENLSETFDNMCNKFLSSENTFLERRFQFDDSDRNSLTDLSNWPGRRFPNEDNKLNKDRILSPNSESDEKLTRSFDHKKWDDERKSCLKTKECRPCAVPRKCKSSIKECRPCAVPRKCKSSIKECRPCAVPRECKPCAVPRECKSSIKECRPCAVPRECKPCAVPRECKSSIKECRPCDVPRKCKSSIKECRPCDIPRECKSSIKDDCSREKESCFTKKYGKNRKFSWDDKDNRKDYVHWTEDKELWPHDYKPWEHNENEDREFWPREDKETWAHEDGEFWPHEDKELLSRGYDFSERKRCLNSECECDECECDPCGCGNENNKDQVYWEDKESLAPEYNPFDRSTGVGNYTY
jgi:hypothetical protein